VIISTDLDTKVWVFCCLELIMFTVIKYSFIKNSF